MTAVWLALLALVLAGPVPDALNRARWTARAPRAAIVLWQAVALAAVLAAVGSALAGPEQLLRLQAAQRNGLVLGVDAYIAMAAAALMAGIIVLRLVATLGLLAVRTRRRRRRHRDLVDLLGSDRAAGDLRILDAEHPIAYCVPGRRSRIVVSSGAMRALSPAQVDAVVEHERAHLRSRHDLVIEGFTALHEAFPRFVRSRVALDAVSELLEMLADDRAARGARPDALRGALEVMAGDGDERVIARIRRLDAAEPIRTASPATLGYAAAAAVLLVPTVAVAMPWLQSAYEALPL